MKGRSFTLALVAAVVALLYAPACSPSASAQKVTTVTVTMNEFIFILSRTTVPHGTVVFKLVNKGAMSHDFKIQGKKSAMIGKGKSGTLKIVLKAGAKPYVCTVAGHAITGMKGTLKVS